MMGWELIGKDLERNNCVLIAILSQHLTGDVMENREKPPSG
jgi:hypothetical protein